MKLFACSTAAALSSMAVKAAPASSANQSTSSIPAPSITNQVTGPIDVFPILHAAVNPGKINWFTNGALPQHGGNSVASCQFSSGTSILWYDTVKASAPLNFNGQIPVYLIYFYNPSTTSTFLTTDATIINNFANNFGSSSMWTNVIQAYSYQSVSPGIPYLAKVVNQACSGTSTYSCASHDNIIYDSNGVISPSASSNTDIVITLIGAKKIPPHTQAVYAIIGGPGTSYTISETSGSINVVNMPIGGSTNTPTCSRKMYLLYYSGVACQGGGSKAFTCTTSSGESAPCCKLEVARIQYPTAGTLCASLLINPNAGITTTPNNNIALDHAIAFLAHEISEMAGK